LDVGSRCQWIVTFDWL